MTATKRCICGELLTNYGNNPEGAMCLNAFGEPEEMNFSEDSKCCDECNMRFVIPGRLFKLRSVKN